MSADKLVDSTMLDFDLTSVANAIRTKGGTSQPLLFPEDFITAIMAISTAIKRRNTGEVVNFNTESSMIIEVQIEPTQSGSGDPSPSNIRPISGWTQANITRTGKNMCPGLTIGYWANGTEYNVGGVYKHTPKIKCSPNTQYTLSFENYTGWSRMSFAFYDVNGNYITHVNESTNQTCTTPANCYFITANVRHPSNGANIPSEAMLEYGNEITSYETYTSTIYTFDLNGTCYGGTLNVQTGVLTVTKANIASYAGETLTGEWISDRDVYAPGTMPTIGAQVVYDLETPQTVQLTQQHVTIIVGVNNIWADTGDVTVEYVEVRT